MNARIEQLQQWLQKDPADNFTNYALAMEYVSIGNNDEAKSILENLIKTQPDYHASYYHLGQLLERLGDNEQAILVYKKGMEVTKKLGEQHAFGELRSVLEELEF